MSGRARRIAVVTAILVALLIVVAASSERDEGSAPEAAVPSPPARVVAGVLPKDGTVQASVGDVVELEVQSESPDEAEIPVLGVRGPVDRGMPAELAFVADAPGRYTVDLRYSGRRVGTVVIKP